MARRPVHPVRPGRAGSFGGPAVRNAVVFGLATVLGGLALLGGGPATAAEPPGPEVPGAAQPLVVGETTIPAAPHDTPRDVTLDGAGTGVSWRSGGSQGRLDRRWWNPATGISEAVGGCDGPVNADTVFCGTLPEAATFRVRDLADGGPEHPAERVRDRPEGHRWTGAHTADQALSWAPGGDGAGALHLLGLAVEPGGQAPADVRIDLPETVRMTSSPTLLGQDGRGAFLSYVSDGKIDYGLVDFASATFRPVPAGFPDVWGPGYALTQDWLVQFEDPDHWSDPVVRLVSRADGVTSREVRVPTPEGLGAVRTLGDWVLATDRNSGGPLRAVHLTNGTALTVLPKAATSLVAGADGTLYAAGGTDATHWGLRRIALDAAGAPAAELIETVPAVAAKRSSVRVGQGRLTYVEDRGIRTVRTHEVGWAAEPPVPGLDPVRTCRALDGEDWCEEAPLTMEDGRQVLLGTEDNGPCRGCTTVVRVREGADAPAAQDKVWRFTDPATRPRTLVSGSGRHVLGRTAKGVRIVLDLDTGRIVWTGTDPAVAGAALSGGTLWMLKGRAVSGLDLATGTATAPLATGSTCTLKSFQVTGDWALLACAYDSTGSVVVDLATGRRISGGGLIGAGAVETLLGHGYVVVAGPTADLYVDELTVVDVRSGTAAVAWRSTALDARAFAAWDLDPNTGLLAFADTERNLRTVSLSRAATPLRVTDRRADATWNRQSPTSWAWWLNRPASAWRVTVTDTVTGTVVRTYDGGAVRSRIAVAWDGRNAAGKGVPNGSYTWTATARPTDGGAEARAVGAFTVTGAAGGYRPLAPARLMDTGAGLGVAKRPVGAGATVTLDVAGKGGVPRSGVSAVVLNVTAADASAATFVSVHPAASARTSASNLNVVPGRPVSNLVVVPFGTGKVSFYNRAGRVRLLADVAGYYTNDGEGARFRPLAATRVLDTRSGVGVRKGKVGRAGTVTLPVAGRGGVPATGVTAVVMNVTATGTSASTFVSVYPSGRPRPATSSVNALARTTVANQVVVPVVDGKVVFYNHAGTTDLLADVAGYYTGTGSGALFQALTPSRLYDSRAGLPGAPPAKLGPGKKVALYPVGWGGVPKSGVSAVVMNVTTTNASGATYVSVYAEDKPRPDLAGVHLAAGQTMPNLMTSPVSPIGGVTVYNRAGTVDVIVDVAGYFIG